MFSQKIQNSLNKRYRSEKIFKFSGLLAVVIAVMFLVTLFSAVIYRGLPAFVNHKIALEVNLSDGQNNNYRQVIKDALKAKFPEAKTAIEKANL